MFHQAITTAGFRICQAIKKTIAFRIFDHLIKVAFFLVAKRFAVTDEILKIACVRLIDVRIINFVYDAVAQREPDAATGVIRGAHALFRARGPARLNTRRAKRYRTVRRTHP